MPPVGNQPVLTARTRSPKQRQIGDDPEVLRLPMRASGPADAQIARRSKLRVAELCPRAINVAVMVRSMSVCGPARINRAAGVCTQTKIPSDRDRTESPMTRSVWATTIELVLGARNAATSSGEICGFKRISSKYFQEQESRREKQNRINTN